MRALLTTLSGAPAFTEHLLTSSSSSSRPISASASSSQSERFFPCSYVWNAAPSCPCFFFMVSTILKGVFPCYTFGFKTHRKFSLYLGEKNFCSKSHVLLSFPVPRFLLCRDFLLDFQIPRKERISASRRLVSPLCPWILSHYPFNERHGLLPEGSILRPRRLFNLATSIPFFPHAELSQRFRTHIRGGSRCHRKCQTRFLQASCPPLDSSLRSRLPRDGVLAAPLSEYSVIGDGLDALTSRDAHSDHWTTSSRVLVQLPVTRVLSPVHSSCVPSARVFDLSPIFPPPSPRAFPV